MALFIVFVALIWGGSMGITLLMTRNRLSLDNVSIFDQLIVRAVAFLSVSIAMLTLGAVSGRTAAASETTGMVPYLWFIALIPLFIPPVKRNGVYIISSEKLLYSSVLLSATGGFTLAIATLVQLIRNVTTLM